MRIQLCCKLVCKTIGLRKVYKNLPISEAALGDAYIAVCSPDAAVPLAFQTKVLPFGARAAVMGFCRTSYAICLNWKTSDEKEGGFNSLARILGVQIDLADAHLGVAVVSNVESRVRELVAFIDDILGRGILL